MEDFYKRIKNYCAEKNISMEDLAKKINMSRSGFYSALKNFTLKVDAYQKIADVLEVPILELLSGFLNFVPSQPFIKLDGIDKFIINDEEFNRLKDEIKFNAKIGKGLIFIEFDEVSHKFITAYENLKEPVKQEFLNQIENSWMLEQVIDDLEKDSKGYIEDINYKKRNK